MRFRLSAGERSSSYRPGQFVSATYAKRYPDKVAEVVEAPPIPEEPFEEDLYDDSFSDEWELTAHYLGDG